jgi:glycosyltransferase involved in cell wall biosynthesis
MKSILYIGNKLSRHGFTPGVIETLGPLLEKEGYNIGYSGTYKNRFLRFAEMIWKTATTGRRVDYILIDTYSTSAFRYAFFCGMIAKLTGTKYIPILHGGDLPSRLKRSKRACGKLFKNSFANVAVSGYLSHEFEKAGYRTIVIPNSIDISKYPFRLREKPRPKLLWVRAFHRQYNPLMAADVLANLLENYPDAELCMVGPDKDGSMEEFRKYIRLKGIENNVTITGKLTREEWIALSEKYDFFLNTTNVDNTPVSVIEAMALGLIMVSTNVGGIPYLLYHEKDSFLVDAENPSQMTNVVIELMNNSELAARLCQNARKKAEIFGWESVKKSWMELLSL